MAYNSVEGTWAELKGKIKTTFGKLTDDEIESLKGNIEQLSGKLQKTYGYAKDEAEKKYKDFKVSAQTYFDQLAEKTATTANQKIEKLKVVVDNLSDKMTESDRRTESKKSTANGREQKKSTSSPKGTKNQRKEHSHSHKRAV